jgi:pyridoxamine 5'-phosphate oxidase
MPALVGDGIVMKDIREEYGAASLEASELLANPLEQARIWVNEAVEAELPLPNAMTLATATAEGRPSARTVLLKDIDGRGLTFFTHHDSRKGEEMASNPHVAVTLFWQPFSRQITLTGRVERLAVETSREYFATRPRGSQLSAAVSPQSRPVDRDELIRRIEEMELELDGAEVPMPEQWGGYRIIPDEIQFWHGRPDRLHDRFRYTPDGEGGWRIERLAP